jgi:hypothetical protein
VGPAVPSGADGADQGRPTVKTIHHLVDIDSPAAGVWESLTESDRLAGWWSTKLRTPAAAVGARVHWTFAGDFNPVMEIIGLDAYFGVYNFNWGYYLESLRLLGVSSKGKPFEAPG